ncbi:hypothetical protein D3C72_1121160 [compost metagenome]
MCDIDLYTVTLIRFSDGSMAIDRATQPEAVQIQKWFEEGKLSFVPERKMFLINSTGYTKMLGTDINITYISWYGELGEPFFGFREIKQGPYVTPMPHPSLATYVLIEGELRIIGHRKDDHAYEEYVDKYMAKYPHPDADPSIPEELEVEKDEQPVISPAEVTQQSWKNTWGTLKPADVDKMISPVGSWPVFMPNGMYNRELHEANCQELQQMYPGVLQVVPVLNDAVIKERCRRIGNALGRFVDRVMGASKKCQEDITSIDEQMQEAHAVANSLDPSAIVDKAIGESVVAPVAIREKDPRDPIDSIVDHYFNLLTRSELSFVPYGMTSDELRHLYWMLQEMKMNPHVPTNKKYRWLTFIQDALIEMRLTTRGKMREFLTQLRVSQQGVVGD